MALVSSTSSLGGFSGGNALARLLVVISGDSSQLDAALAKAAGSSASFGEKMSGLGNALTRGVTLPVIALGGAALYMASQFQSGLARIAGLTPILDQTGQSIGQVSDALLKLAGTVPTSPNDLAESLYYAGSAGLQASKGAIQASEAFKVVEASAKGAAIGMGNAGDITRVLIAALNNFRTDGLTTAKAMDVLTASIREGTAAPDELAIALGRLLPIAKQAGQSFEDTAASVAALTNLGVPTRVATTSLRALFAELLAPTEAATTRLRELGISAEELRGAFANLGPVGAFDLINKAVKGDQDALHDILPQIRGFTAFVGLNADQMREYKHTLDAVRNSQGAFAKAFEKIQQTPQFKFELALNKLRVAAIKFGTTMFPIFEKLIGILSGVGDALSSLNGPARALIVAFAGMAAAAGPLLKLLSAMGVFTPGIVTGFKAIGTTSVVMAAGLLAAVAGFKQASSGAINAGSSLETFGGAAVAAYAGMRLLQAGAKAVAQAQLDAGKGISSVALALTNLSGPELVGIAAGIGAIALAIGIAIGQSHELEKAMAQAGKSLGDAAIQGTTFREAIQGIADASIRTQIFDIAKSFKLLDETAGSALDTFKNASGTKLASSLGQLQTVLSDQHDLSGFADQLKAVIPAIQKAAVSGKTLTSALKPLGVTTSDVDNWLDMLAHTGEAAAKGTDAAYVSAQNLFESYSAGQRALQEFNTQQQGNIVLTQAAQQQVQDLAHKTGASVDFINQKLNEYGQTAGTMTDETTQQFLDAAEGPHNLSLAVQEANQQIAESVKGIEDSISQAFAGFDKADTAANQIKDLRKQLAAGDINAKDFAKQFAELNVTVPEALSNLRKNVEQTVQTVADLRTLAERGVPVDILGFLADQDPRTISRFADSSKSQLKELVALYQEHLGAMDDEIIKEKAHQVVKGKSMVAGFADAMLSNSSLPPQAAAKIVQDTTQAFISGDITSKGLKVATQFATGLAAAHGLSHKEGAAAVTAFVAGIQNIDLKHVGETEMEQLAAGIANSADISKSKARDLVDRVFDTTKTEATNLGPFAGKLLVQKYTEGIAQDDPSITAAQRMADHAIQAAREASNGMFQIGVNFAQDFAAGVKTGTNVAAAAAAQLAIDTRNALTNALQNSPEFFTFYQGQKLVDDLQRGIDTRPVPHIPNPTFDSKVKDTSIGSSRLSYPVGSRDLGRASGGSRRHSRRDIDLTVRVGRKNVARETDWDMRNDGRD